MCEGLCHNLYVTNEEKILFYAQLVRLVNLGYHVTLEQGAGAGYRVSITRHQHENVTAESASAPHAVRDALTKL